MYISSKLLVSQTLGDPVSSNEYRLKKIIIRYDFTLFLWKVGTGVFIDPSKSRLKMFSFQSCLFQGYDNFVK